MPSLKTSILVGLASAASGVLSQATVTANATTTITTVVTALTTFCPEPTVLTFNEVCYTVTEPTTLTVTNCPCTITTCVPVVTRPVTGTGSYMVPVAPTVKPTYQITSGADRTSAFGLAVALGAVVVGAAAL